MPRSQFYAMAAGPNGAVLVNTDGEVESLSLAQAASRLNDGAIVCNRPLLARWLGPSVGAARDVLELFAFARPATFCVPTPRGLAAALMLDEPGHGPEAEALTVLAAAQLLMQDLADPSSPYAAGAAEIALGMARAGWAWGSDAAAALGPPKTEGGAFEVWRSLPEWEDLPPETPPLDIVVEPQAARDRLAQLLGGGREARPAQADYAAAASAAFAPRDAAGQPRLVVAEAGTGIGKTLGYIAPASLWAQHSGGTVWISTYTKNLQRQIDQELDRLYPDPRRKAERAVIRKGRENYLCLLNYQDALQSQGNPVLLGLIARWARFTRDGDVTGGDLPGWLPSLFAPSFSGGGRLTALTDRRGECIYAACPHYRKCFIERGIRRAREAEIVVSNHALVMAQAVRIDGLAPPLRLVFDEGHHLFDAADGAFSAHLTGREGGELRRWLRGAEGGRKGRARGLAARYGDLVAGEAAAAEALDDCIRAAACLPSEGWQSRIAEGMPQNESERLLARVRAQAYARAPENDDFYGLEASPNPPIPGLVEDAAQLDRALADLQRPLVRLIQLLAARLDDDAAELDRATRARIESACRSLRQRGEGVVAAWRSMLQQIGGASDAEFVDWLAVDRADGRDIDIGLHRHFVDPTKPFAELLLRPSHGALITSATLRDRAAEETPDWAAADLRTGAGHLALPPLRFAADSPFDYAARTRVFIVTDVARGDAVQVAAAYRELFLAAGGGGLGLFTAVQRLRAVHARLVGPLDAAGIPLFAQHVDPMDNGVLVDMFRLEPDACLLGTDAMRDGVDVPGRALRLVVFDRTPWPRPTLLHRARRAAFGARGYDDQIVRMRLKQAFGRLVRRADDAGVFVILDTQAPSRLLTAFPPGVAVARVGLAEAVAHTRTFLAATHPAQG